jgi:uncharacterized glyoxalase superfamily protein PhnB
MALEVDSADEVADAMLRAGTTVIYPVSDHDYGRRGGRLADPFGHLWMIAQPLPPNRERPQLSRSCAFT